jgi:hypothetical protein
VFDHDSAIREVEVVACSQGVRSSGSPPFDHDSVTCWVVRLFGAKRVRSSPGVALDHDSIGLRLAVESELRSTGSASSRDHSPTAKTAQNAAPTDQMFTGIRL